MGDFNYGEINWECDTIKGNRGGKTDIRDIGTQGQGQFFLEKTKDCYHFQHITKDTRVRGSQKPSLLDLVLTNEKNMVKDVEHFSLLGKSDHSIIAFKYITYIKKEHKK